MENKNVGWLIIGISFVMVILVLIFNIALKNITDQTCNHGSSCSMYTTVSIQTGVSLTIVGIIFIIGLVIMFTKPKEKIIIKTIKEKKKKLNLTGLSKEEKKVIELLKQENGGMFQADLGEKISVGKVGMTRLLDKLESKQLIERKRRGMNNIVVLINS